MREDARREGKCYSFEDVLLISEVVSTSSARKDYDDCTAKYGRYGIPIYLVVDPYAREVPAHRAHRKRLQHGPHTRIRHRQAPHPAGRRPHLHPRPRRTPPVGAGSRRPLRAPRAPLRVVPTT
ncbi:Uma2 family endonuclease [Streptomyces sp. LZ34]